MNYYSKCNRIIIFGANSMVGSYLLSHLLNQGYDNIHCVVRSFDRCSVISEVASSYGIDNVFQRSVFEVGQSSDYDFVEKLLSAGDVIFNCAAAVSLNDNDSSIIETNIKISHNVAQASLRKQVKLVVHVSSVSVLGKDLNGVSRENIVPEQILSKNYYSQSKFYSEGEFWRAYYGGTNVIIVNPSVILGIGNYNGNSSARLIKQFSRGALFGSKGVTGWVSAEDVALSMEKLSQCEQAIGERFIINGENTSYGEIIDLIAKSAGKKGVMINIGSGILRGVFLIVNILSKLKISLGLSPQSIKGLGEKSYFDNTKIKNMIGIEFSPIYLIIEKSVKHYKRIKK